MMFYTIAGFLTGALIGACAYRLFNKRRNITKKAQQEAPAQTTAGAVIDDQLLVQLQNLLSYGIPGAQKGGLTNGEED